MIPDIKKADLAAGNTQRFNEIVLLFSGDQRSDVQNRYLGEIQSS